MYSLTISDKERFGLGYKLLSQMSDKQTYEQNPAYDTPCQLIATKELDGNIFIIMRHDDVQGLIVFNLDDIDAQRYDIRKYITKLLPTIKAGKLDIELVMQKVSP